jgi:hypothetical protein
LYRRWFQTFAAQLHPKECVMHKLELLQRIADLAKPYTKLGEVYITETAHDEDCPMRDGNSWTCTCQPNVTLIYVKKNGQPGRRVRLMTEGVDVTSTH